MKKRKLSLKRKVKVALIILLLTGVTFITTGTIMTSYARYTDNKQIKVKTTTGNIIVDATLDNPGTFTGDGYSYFDIVLTNHVNGNITKVPASCTLTVNSNETDAQFRYVDKDGNGISDFVSEFTTRVYNFGNTTTENQTIRVEVKNETGEQQTLDIDAEVNCSQKVGE